MGVETLHLLIIALKYGGGWVVDIYATVCLIVAQLSSGCNIGVV